MLKSIIKNIGIVSVLSVLAIAGGSDARSGVSVSLILPGTMSIGPDSNIVDVDTEMGKMIKYTYDAQSESDIVTGFYAAYTTITAENTDATMMEAGVSIKKTFVSYNQNSRLGVNVGYRLTSISDMTNSESSGLALNFNYEVDLKETSDGMLPFVELGFTTQPIGGNADYVLTWSPLLYIGAGIHF